MKIKSPKRLKNIFVMVVAVIVFIAEIFGIVWLVKHIFGNLMDIIFAVVWFVVTTVFTISMCLYGLLSPPPPPPIIQYAEIPFELVYEIDGNIEEIKDTLICEYAGWETTGGGIDKQRCWSKHFESGKDEIIIFDNGETTVEWEFFSAAAYMGDDNGFEKRYYGTDPRFYANSKEVSYRRVSENELLSEFGIIIIEYKMPEPIENEFSNNLKDIIIHWFTNELK